MLKRTFLFLLPLLLHANSLLLSLSANSVYNVVLSSFAKTKLKNVSYLNVLRSSNSVPFLSCYFANFGLDLKFFNKQILIVKSFKRTYFMPTSFNSSSFFSLLSSLNIPHSSTFFITTNVTYCNILRPILLQNSSYASMRPHIRVKSLH